MSTINKKRIYMMTFLIIACGLFIVSTLYIMIPLSEMASELFHVSMVHAAWSSTVTTFFYAIGFIFFGTIVDRVGTKKILFYGMLFLAMITLLICFVHTYHLFLILRGLQGFLASSVPIAIYGYIFDVFPVKAKATSLALATTSFLIAGVFGQITSSWIGYSLGWVYIFLFYGVFYLLLAICSLKAFPKIPEKNSSFNIVEILRDYLDMFKKPVLVCGLVITFTLLLAFIALYSTLGSFLKNEFGLTYQQILLVRSTGILGLILAPLVNMLSPRFSLSSILISGLIGAILGLVLLLSVSSISLISLSTVIFAAGISIAVPSTINLIGTFAGKSRSLAITLFTFILFSGGSIGSIIGSTFDLRTVAFILIGILGVSLVLQLMNEVRQSKQNQLYENA